MRVIHLAIIDDYKPPAGFRIASILRLADGTYEVTIEPRERDP